MAKKIKDLMMSSRTRMLVQYPWYGIFASQMIFKESEDVPVMGVSIGRDNVYCWYNPNGVEQYNIKQVIAILQHEVEHIVRLQCTRVGSRDHNIWNIAADAIVNGPQKAPNIADLPENCIWYTHPQNGQTTEVYYKWLLKNAEKVAVGPSTGVGELIDDHSVWSRSTSNEDWARQLVQSMASTASKQAGNIPGSLKDAIEKLNDPKVNWGAILKAMAGRYCGLKRKTYSRINRRIDLFGMRGTSSHGSNALTICVDTSGSVDRNLLEQFFSEIEKISQKFRITLVQFDHGIQSIERYRKGDWKKIDIHGRGGTSFIELCNGLEDKKAVGKLTIILTDGYAEWPEQKPYPVLWAVDGPSEPPWGQYVKIQ